MERSRQGKGTEWKGQIRQRNGMERAKQGEGRGL